MPSTSTAASCLPSFFAEGKGFKGLADVCKNQAIYDGALGARGILKLRSYIDPKTAYDNDAYTIISIYHSNRFLIMYATYPVKSTNWKHQIEFRMIQLRFFAMTDAPDTFRQGAAAWRNGRDLTKEKREELIAAATLKYWKQIDHSKLKSSTQSFMSISSNQLTHSESEKSADELVLDINTSATSIIKSLAQARTKLLSKVSINRQSKRNSRTNKLGNTIAPVTTLNERDLSG